MATLNVSDSATLSEQVGFSLPLTFSVSDSVSDSEQFGVEVVSFVGTADAVTVSEQIRINELDIIVEEDPIMMGDGPGFVHIGGAPVIPAVPVFTSYRTTGVAGSPFQR